MPWQTSSSVCVVGDPFAAESHMGPLVSERQRAQVERYIAKGEDRRGHTRRRWRSPATSRPWVLHRTDAVLRCRQLIGDRPGGDFRTASCVIRAVDEEHAVKLANDTIYGLNASVFTDDLERAAEVASQLRSGTVGHNAFRTDFGIAFGGFKQSGIGREGGTEGLLPFLETKTVILKGRPAKYQ